MAGRQRMLMVVVAALAVALLAGPGTSVPGAKGPGKRSAKRMKIRFTPKRAPAGSTFKGVARGFAGGEPVSAQEEGRGRRASRLPGGTASRDGRVRVLRRTFSSSKPGARKLCVRGERSRRVACGRYRVTPGAGAEEEDLVLDEETESPDETEEGDLLLDLDGDGGLFDLDGDEDPLDER